MPAKKKQLMTGSDACVCMHTALRKLCDSRITSAVYNFIHILCDMDELGDLNPWLVLGEFVAEEINKGRKPYVALTMAAGYLDRKFSEKINIARDKCLQCLLQLASWIFLMNAIGKVWQAILVIEHQRQT